MARRCVLVSRLCSGCRRLASMVVNSTEGAVFNANSAAVFESAGQSWQWVARCGPTMRVLLGATRASVWP